MCSRFSMAAKPCTGVSNDKIMCQKTTIAAARAGVTIAPKQRSSQIFPVLSKQDIPYSTALHVSEIVERQSQGNSLAMEDACISKPQFHPMFLEEAYERCRNICAEYAKTFYLGNIFLLVLSKFPSCCLCKAKCITLEIKFSFGFLMQEPY